MQLFLRKIAVLLIAAGLVLSGATSHANAAKSAAGDDTAMHKSHQIQNYADLVIEPGEPDCPHLAADASGDAPMHHSQGTDLCKKCCAACTSVSLLPAGAGSVLPMSHELGQFVQTPNVLIAHAIPIDPGIPKTL